MVRDLVVMAVVATLCAAVLQRLETPPHVAHAGTATGARAGGKA